MNDSDNDDSLLETPSDKEKSVTTTQPTTVSIGMDLKSNAMVDTSLEIVPKTSAEAPITELHSSNASDGVSSCKDDECKLDSPLDEYDSGAIRQSRHISTNRMRSGSISRIFGSKSEVVSEEDTSELLP